jgi:hypothetical protein
MANSSVTCKSFTLYARKQRPNVGTAVDFVSYDEVGQKGSQNGAIQTNGPSDQQALLRDVFRVLSTNWPSNDLRFEVNKDGEIVRVL